MPTRPEVTGRRRANEAPNVQREPGHGSGQRAPPPATDPLALLAKRQLAELLAVDPWTIDRWRKSDPDFPEPIWVSGTTPRWQRVEVERWLASRRRGGKAPEWNQATARRQRATREASDAR